MSFVGAIDSDKHKVIWSRSILSLAAISEHIKFVVGRESISILAVNTAKITHAEITFKQSFFHEYLVDFGNILSEGFNEDEYDINQSTYSFLINSRHLSVLFKNLDALNLEYICFKVNWDKNSSVKYKLLIEIKTQDWIIKRYQTSYQPVVSNKLNIATLYKQELLDQQEKILQDSIKYIMIEQIIPKQFLDSISSSTEDFKIEIKHGKLLLCGYTRQVLKDKEYLKQPMSVTNTITLDELLNTNLTDFNLEDNTLSINFRLKDFKNFMNLISGFANLKYDLADDHSTDGNSYFEIFFKSPGDPILFELKNYPHVLIQYTQITSDDNLESNKKPKFSLPSHSVIIPNKEETPLPEQTPSPGELITSKPFSKKIDYESVRSLIYGELPPMESEPQEQRVTYGKRSRTPSLDLSKRQKTNNQNDTDYGSDSSESSDTIQTQLLGPTQAAEKPKSIFD